MWGRTVLIGFDRFWTTFWVVAVRSGWILISVGAGPDGFGRFWPPFGSCRSVPVVAVLRAAGLSGLDAISDRIRISGRYVGLTGFPLGALIKRTDALIKRTDALLKRTDALIKRIDALTKRNDALIKRNDALTKRSDALIKRSNVTAAGAGAAKRSATILR